MNKSSFLLIVVLLISGLFLLSCRNDKNHSTENIRKSSDIESFEDFWIGFKSAVLNQDKATVVRFTRIPFEDGYGNIYSPEKSLTSHTKEHFLLFYDDIFNKSVLSAIRENKVEIKKNDHMHELVIKINHPLDYILNGDSQLGNRDLLFSQVDGKYKLVGIQYYP